MTISEGRVYRLMKQMKLPKMSAVKPPKAAAYKEKEGVCQNLLSPKFDPKAPNSHYPAFFRFHLTMVTLAFDYPFPLPGGFGSFTL